jgi:riboflavin kinase/FMN adenylyltransferase
MKNKASYTGIVLSGEKTGTKLGFPTANIAIEDPNVTGIYAAKATVEGKTYMAGVYANQRRKILEAHLFDFSEDLYGKEITITLFEKVRDDKKFADFAGAEELSKTIALDIQKVKEYFENQ